MGQIRCKQPIPYPTPISATADDSVPGGGSSPFIVAFFSFPSNESIDSDDTPDVDVCVFAFVNL